MARSGPEKRKGLSSPCSRTGTQPSNGQTVSEIFLSFLPSLRAVTQAWQRTASAGLACVGPPPPRDRSGPAPSEPAIVIGPGGRRVSPSRVCHRGSPAPPGSAVWYRLPAPPYGSRERQPVAVAVKRPQPPAPSAARSRRRLGSRRVVLLRCRHDPTTPNASSPRPVRPRRTKPRTGLQRDLDGVPGL